MCITRSIPAKTKETVSGKTYSHNGFNATANLDQSNCLKRERGITHAKEA